MIFAVKMNLDNTYGLLNNEYPCFLMYVIILISSFFQNLKFKIQILVGNKLKIYVGACFEISTTLIWKKMKI